MRGDHQSFKINVRSNRDAHQVVDSPVYTRKQLVSFVFAAQLCSETNYFTAKMKNEMRYPLKSMYGPKLFKCSQMCVILYFDGILRVRRPRHRFQLPNQKRFEARLQRKKNETMKQIQNFPVYPKISSSRRAKITDCLHCMPQTREQHTHTHTRYVLCTATVSIDVSRGRPHAR